MLDLKFADVIAVAVSCVILEEDHFDEWTFCIQGKAAGDLKLTSRSAHARVALVASMCGSGLKHVVHSRALG